jgi:4-diphosphocytidyl-2-C-methyl-D-erythritol kinase
MLLELDCTVDAPAKINLSLRVVGRRADGYHLLDSIFVPLSFADRLAIRARAAPTLSVSCSCPAKPELSGSDNLAARAAARLLQRVGAAASVAITIDKRIWQAAGLGGGSSDAAAVLLTLNRALRERGLARAELERLALELGADVPYFLDPGPRRAQGIGEKLTPVHGLPALNLVLANPGLPLSTPDVFRGLELAPGTRLDPPAQPERIQPSLEAIAALMVNDLEPVATRLCPPVGELKARLLALGARAACMSGSGATVFGLFDDAEVADRAQQDISSIPECYAVRTTTGCSLTAPG